MRRNGHGRAAEICTPPDVNHIPARSAAMAMNAVSECHPLRTGAPQAVSGCASKPRFSAAGRSLTQPKLLIHHRRYRPVSAPAHNSHRQLPATAGKPLSKQGPVTPTMDIKALISRQGCVCSPHGRTDRPRFPEDSRRNPLLTWVIVEPRQGSGESTPTLGGCLPASSECGDS